jgi:hypothetical protein
MASTPASGAAPAAGELGKGGKPVVVKDKARAEFLAVMAARLDEIRHSRDSYRPEDQHLPAEVILSIEGIGYMDPLTGQFSEKKPAATKGKSASHYSAASFIPQFFITTGFGPGFAHTRAVVVSNPIFFRPGEGPGSKKPKILGGHDPVFKVGDFVFMRSGEGTASYTTSVGVGRWSATETSAVRYTDLYAVLPKAEAVPWIKERFLVME